MESSRLTKFRLSALLLIYIYIVLSVVIALIVLFCRYSYQRE